MPSRSYLILFATMMIALTTSGGSATAQTLDITGNYDCEGRNADGGAYRGQVEIVRKRDIYLVRWRVGSDDVYDGVGILTGDVLSVSYSGAISGIVVYEVKDEQTLAGRWAINSGDGRVFVENLTRKSPTPSPPG